MDIKLNLQVSFYLISHTRLHQASDKRGRHQEYDSMAVYSSKMSKAQGLIPSTGLGSRGLRKLKKNLSQVSVKTSITICTHYKLPSVNTGLLFIAMK